MFGSRTLTAAIGLVGSLLLSAVLWWYFDALAVFLFLPFVPFLFRRAGGGGRAGGSTVTYRECPQCGFRTADPDYEYCPRDGARLRATDGPRR
ncbi:hypothetical protein [Halomicrobium urmianum]|uniref:hypothetical protein n=1 Tax=Halomicrobium urmianum TaxID=1586233 RepID=UPI001CD9683D|nr:hypothetical protein [Halomicrobium urmianum]